MSPFSMKSPTSSLLTASSHIALSIQLHRNLALGAGDQIPKREGDELRAFPKAWVCCPNSI